MKLYRVAKLIEGGNSDGFEWFGSLGEAKAFAKGYNAESGETNQTEPEAFDVRTDKKSLLKFLNRECSYPDNG